MIRKAHKGGNGMKTYPLSSMSLEKARQQQFRLIDCITREFRGQEILSRGDLGVVLGLGKPETTNKVEQVLARFFAVESCMLVRGAGSGAIRLGLHAMAKSGGKILIHKAPIYPTTKISLEMMKMNCVEADFNDVQDIKEVLSKDSEIRLALVQYTRQQIKDSYNMQEVVEAIKSVRNISVLTDDNYAVMKVENIGVQCGADLSCFSSFKLLGPEGIGIIVGKKKYIDDLKQENYSGGLQVQGHEALEVLQGLIYAPVALAIQAQVGEECLIRLNSGEIPQVKEAFLANAQSKVILVEFAEEIAEQVLAEAEKLGAAPNPVGAESKYEFVPMFYRISGTFRAAAPNLEKRMIRINPMRAGAETVMRIIKESIERVNVCF